MNLDTNEWVAGMVRCARKTIAECRAYTGPYHRLPGRRMRNAKELAYRLLEGMTAGGSYEVLNENLFAEARRYRMPSLEPVVDSQRTIGTAPLDVVVAAVCYCRVADDPALCAVPVPGEDDACASYAELRGSVERASPFELDWWNDARFVRAARVAVYYGSHGVSAAEYGSSIDGLRVLEREDARTAEEIRERRAKQVREATAKGVVLKPVCAVDVELAKRRLERERAKAAALQAKARAGEAITEDEVGAQTIVYDPSVHVVFISRCLWHTLFMRDLVHCSAFCEPVPPVLLLKRAAVVAELHGHATTMPRTSEYVETFTSIYAALRLPLMESEHQRRCLFGRGVTLDAAGALYLSGRTALEKPGLRLEIKAMATTQGVPRPDRSREWAICTADSFMRRHFRFSPLASVLLFPFQLAESHLELLSERDDANDRMLPRIVISPHGVLVKCARRGRPVLFDCGNGEDSVVNALVAWLNLASGPGYDPPEHLRKWFAGLSAGDAHAQVHAQAHAQAHARPQAPPPPPPAAAEEQPFEGLQLPWES